MKRRHNVIAGTLLLLGLVYLGAKREAGILDLEWYTGGKAQQEHGGHASHLKLDHGAASGTPSLPFGNAQPSPVPGDDGALPPSDSSQSQQDAPVQFPLPKDDTAPAPYQPEFVFQEDLKLDFPDSIIKSFSKYAPLHYGPDIPKTYAYATFMSTRNPSIKDPYFISILAVIHRLLWAPQSRTEKYPVIAYVGEWVTQEQRDILAGTGAIVRVLKPLPWKCNKEGALHRWEDLFAKLNMWLETEFQRIHFLDADAFPVANIDPVFDLAESRTCFEPKMTFDDLLLPDKSTVCEPYVFAGVPQNSFDPLNPEVNVGSMTFTPSVRMHQRLVQNYLKLDKYDCLMAEQAYLNWQFDPKSGYPPTLLERQWGGFFPKDDEEGKLKVVHEKLWMIDHGWMKQEWEGEWEKLRQFFESDEFATARKARGTV